MAALLHEVVTELQVLWHGFRTATIGDQAAILALSSSAPSLSRDSGVCIAFALVFFMFNLSMHKLVFEPVLTKGMGVSKDMKQKFTQAIMSMLIHGGFTIMGLIVVPKQVWIWPSMSWWIGWDKGGFEIMRSDLRCFYLMYAGRYFQSCFSSWFEHKQKDFMEKQIHHWTTFSLIVISYTYGWNRIGAVIMVLLDPTDALLQAAKICKYISECLGDDRQAKFWQRGADVVFAIFTLMFVATRLVMYPYVCWSAQVEHSRLFPKGVAEWTCIVLLDTLLGLQVFWFWQLVRAVHRMFQKGGIEDVRSDDSDAGSDVDAKKKD